MSGTNRRPNSLAMPADPESLLSSEQVQVTQAAGIIALGNIASRAMGLVREMVKSGLFGATGYVSALEVAIQIPTIIYDLTVGGMANSALIPVFSDYARPERRNELWQLLGILLGAISFLLGGLVLLGELFAPQIVWLLAGGLTPRYQEAAAYFLRVTLPAVIFLNAAGILSSALYALKRFTLPAFTAAAANATIVLAALLLGRRWGVHSMAIGLLLGSVCQIALQLPGLRGARPRLALNLRHPALGRIGRLYLPILIGLGVDMLAVLLSYNLASRTGDSSISWMKYAATVIQFPLGLVVTAVSVANLPTLAQYASDEATASFRATLAQGLRLVLLLVIPATAGLFVLSQPVVALLFEHGDFTSADTIATAAALRAALLGLIFAAIDQPLIMAFYARKDTLTPALVGVGTTALYAAMALLPWLLGFLTLPLLVLVNSLKLAAHALVMLLLTHRRIGGLGGHRVGELTVKAGLAALAMSGIVWGLARLAAPLVPTGFLGEVLLVGGCGGIGAVLYSLLAMRMGVDDIHLLRAALVDGLQRLTGGRRAAPAREAERKSVAPGHYDEDYFLSACEGHREFLASEGRELSQRLEMAIGVAGIAPGMRVLDVGCGRGEVLRRCAEWGAIPHGIDYAAAAVAFSRQALSATRAYVYQADARRLPFASATFDRALLFDIVEHLHPWELDQALSEVWRVLRPDGVMVIHTAPNVWYDRYAYPIVRAVRILMGQGEHYPKDPRAIIPANLEVHVNEQSVVGLQRTLRRHGFRGRVWLHTPPQHRRENWLFRLARHILFKWPPFRWFFEREILAVAGKISPRT